MDVLSRKLLRRLAESHMEPCVSIYFATHPAGKAGEQDSIRLKNLVRTAEQSLIERGLRAPVASDLLKSASQLDHNKGFWDKRQHGLAIFTSPDVFAAYRLPATFTEKVTVGPRFHLKPLVGPLEDQCRFHLLVVSQNEVGLYRMTEHSHERLTVVDLPERLTDALALDGCDRGEQVHSAMQGSLGKQAAVFHGQGGAADTKKSDVTAFCRLVNKAVSQHLHGDPDPLLLACVDYIGPIYREVNSSPHLLHTTLSGNQQYRSIKELHEQAVSVVRSFLNERRQAAADQFRHHADTDRTCNNIEHVVKAARGGRIDTLFVDPLATVLGRIGRDDQRIEITNRETDDDLIELAIADTLRTGGNIVSREGLDLPTNSPVAAILRY